MARNLKAVLLALMVIFVAVALVQPTSEAEIHDEDEQASPFVEKVEDATKIYLAPTGIPTAKLPGWRIASRPATLNEILSFRVSWRRNRALGSQRPGPKSLEAFLKLSFVRQARLQPAMPILHAEAT